MKRSIVLVLGLCFLVGAAGFVPAHAYDFGQGRIESPTEPGSVCQPKVIVFSMRYTTIGWEFLVTDELVRPFGFGGLCYRLAPAIVYGQGSPAVGFTGQVRSGPFQIASDGSFSVDSLTFDRPGFINVTGPARGSLFNYP